MSATTSHNRKYWIAGAADPRRRGGRLRRRPHLSAGRPDQRGDRHRPGLCRESRRRGDPRPRPLRAGRRRVGAPVHDRGWPRPRHHAGDRRQARRGDPGARERAQLRDAQPLLERPLDLVQTLIAPRVLKDGTVYLTDRGYEVVSRLRRRGQADRARQRRLGGGRRGQARRSMSASGPARPIRWAR